jgi:hypothetical protein
MLPPYREQTFPSVQSTDCLPSVKPRIQPGQSTTGFDGIQFLNLRVKVATLAVYICLMPASLFL